MRREIIIGLVATLIAIGGNVSSAEPETARRKLQMGTVEPFTYENIIANFRTAGLRAIELQKRCTIFFEGKWKSSNVYDYCVIMVENSDQDVQVTFYLTDAHEMNWVTEFLDAPYFSRSETQKLFGLINSKRDARREPIGRYRVDFHRWQPRHAEILVFSFTPVRARL
ncbi:MAG TPA: hypothetical protein VFA51_06865 [Candidatus Udaeobacter sp.]|nr:hypothetical protein [Candidatus Udaeobacter sp.]